MSDRCMSTVSLSLSLQRSLYVVVLEYLRTNVHVGNPMREGTWGRVTENVFTLPEKKCISERDLAARTAHWKRDRTDPASD